jgi:hypothetical protein
VNCILGQTAGSDGLELDYGFLYGSVVYNSNTQGVRSVPVQDAQVDTFPVLTITDSPFGGQLSDHNGLAMKLKFAQNLVVVITVPTVIGGLIIIFAALALYQTYVRKKRIPAPEWAYVYVRQTRALFIKNWILTIRNRRSLIVQLLVPFVLVAIMFALQYALQANEARDQLFKKVKSSTDTPFPQLPRCKYSIQKTCLSFAYSYNNDTVINQLMDIVAKDNNIPADEIRGFLTPDDVDTYLT